MAVKCEGAVVLVFFFWSATATAQDSSAKQEARELFREANRLVQAGEPQRAIERFRAAYALYPSAKILVNMATTLSALGQETEAAITYERCLRDKNADLTPEIRTLVETALEDLRNRFGRVVVQVNETGAVILLDGLEAGRSPLAQPIWVNSGLHRVEAQKDGFDAVSEAAFVGNGELREFRLELLAKESPVTEPPAAVFVPPAPPVAPVAVQHAPVIRQETAPMWKRWPFWVAVGAGVAATTVFAVLMSGGGGEPDEDALPEADFWIDKRQP